MIPASIHLLTDPVDLHLTVDAKGLLSVDEIELALARTESSLTGDERLYEDMSPANRDAVCFPVRLLRLANMTQGEVGVMSFSELARTVGETKPAYNDQR